MAEKFNPPTICRICGGLLEAKTLERWEIRHAKSRRRSVDGAALQMPGLRGSRILHIREVFVV
jgi:hypothetical protein